MRQADKFNTPQEAIKMGFGFGHTDGVVSLRGTYIIHLTDADTGKVLDHREGAEDITNAK